MFLEAFSIANRGPTSIYWAIPPQPFHVWPFWSKSVGIRNVSGINQAICILCLAQNEKDRTLFR